MSIDVPLWLLPVAADGPLHYIAMNYFSYYKTCDGTWYSPPFYCLEGYKMRLVVNANGFGNRKGTHVSVFVQLLQSEYDDQMVWPYRGKMEVLIINWNKDKHHVPVIIEFCYTAAGQNNSYGVVDCLSHSKLYDEHHKHLYVHNNTMYFKVANITV